MSDQVTAPRRIQLSRAKGWRIPANTVKVDRSTRFGNQYDTRYWGVETALLLFGNTMRGYWDPSVLADRSDFDMRIALAGHDLILARLRPHHPVEAIKSALRGKNLACWCRPDAKCHADILLAIANDAGLA